MAGKLSGWTQSLLSRFKKQDELLTPLTGGESEYMEMRDDMRRDDSRQSHDPSRYVSI